MGRITINDIKTSMGITHTYDIINAIKNESSMLHQYDTLAAKEDIVKFGQGILLNQAVQNDFITTLVDRIENGEHKRKAKYSEYSSIEPKDRAERVWLANLIDNDEETGNEMKKHVGKEITVADVITRKYDKVDPKTGELIYGVLTYLITPEREAFVTSSKGVYFSIMQYMKLLGHPTDSDYEPIIVKVGSKAMQNGDSITIKLIG